MNSLRLPGGATDDPRLMRRTADEYVTFGQVAGCSSPVGNRAGGDPCSASAPPCSTPLGRRGSMNRRR